MNIRKLFTAFGLTMFAFVLGQAQENKTFHYSEASIAESKIELSDEWKTTVIDNVVSIYNGNIQNNSNKTVHNLKLELILSPINSDVSHGVLTGYYLTEAQFKNIRKNSRTRWSQYYQ